VQVSGLTASLALEHVAQLSSSDTLLVTGSYPYPTLYYIAHYSTSLSLSLSLCLSLSLSVCLWYILAAAGGTGVFAVQLGKLAGCHVIGTCSSDDKKAYDSGTIALA
jgi:NADPH-dependent curcumin reductase CurA